MIKVNLPEGMIEYLSSLVEQGELDPNCKMCIEIFYPAIGQGKKLYDIFAPRHKASKHCRSGKHSHCTCDTCF